MDDLRAAEPVGAGSLWAACCPSDAASCLPSRALPWLRLAIGLFIAAQTMTLGLAINITPAEDRATTLLLQGGMLAATGVVIALLGWPLVVEALRQASRRRMTMELLFLAGVGAAMGISLQSMWEGQGRPVYFDVVNILLVVYSVGRAINTRSRQRAMSALQAFTGGIATARLVGGNEERRTKDEGRHKDGARGESAERVVSVEQVQAGDHVRVLPGELIPVDGTILAGVSLVRQTPFTGEWISAIRRPGDAVLAGTACEDGTLLIDATAPGTQRRVDQIGHADRDRPRCSHQLAAAGRPIRPGLPAPGGAGGRGDFPLLADACRLAYRSVQRLCGAVGCLSLCRRAGHAPGHLDGSGTAGPARPGSPIRRRRRAAGGRGRGHLRQDRHARG